MKKTKSIIFDQVWKAHSEDKRKHNLGGLGVHLGILILFSFSIVLVPLFLFFLTISPIYFWLYKEEWVNPKDYFHFDRHNLKEMNFFDALSCEYCEFANGTLEWVLAIANKIEKEWCPIKNNCNADCSKVKKWRKEYVDNDYETEELEHYYKEHFKP